MNIAKMNWMQVEQYLATDDRAILSLGSTEQHAYLSMSTDHILAGKLADDVANKDGVIAFPTIPYGVTPYFMGYPGTVTINLNTYASFVSEVIASIYAHGFRKLLIVNGHGGNTCVHSAIMHQLNELDGLQVKFHNWWASPAVMEKVKSLHKIASHASWMENFPWTRIDGVDVPTVEKAMINIAKSQQQSAKQARTQMGDGNYGGYYQHDNDEDMHAIWQIAIDETSKLLNEGWL